MASDEAGEMYLESAECVSSPTSSPKRQCTWEGSPLLFSSSDSSSSSSDGAYFPSDHSAHHGMAAEDPEKDDPAEDESLSHVASRNSCSERELVGSLLVSKCCGRQCFLRLTALDVLSPRKRYRGITH